LICRNGEISKQAIGLLLKAGFSQVKYLEGGINAWAKEVDPSLPIY